MPIVSTPTGLSEEEDAGRFLRFQFDSESVGFCRNCEGYYEAARDAGGNVMQQSCPVCESEWLYWVGTKPLPFRMKR